MEDVFVFKGGENVQKFALITPSTAIGKKQKHRPAGFEVV